MTAPGAEPPAPPAAPAPAPAPGTAAQAAPPPSKAAPLRLIREIGRGGMGVVHAAEQRALRREVAVKMALRKGDAEAEGAFTAEAIATARLDHPNVVAIHDLGRDAQGCLYIAMKLVRGVSWRSLMAGRRGAPGELRDHLEILLKVADAVAYAHSRGIIHRDLKPENVMVGEFGEVLVMDWGLALDFAESAERVRALRAEGKPARSAPTGTPRYMSPELATGDLAAMGPRTDVYLLGAIVYELITGHPPHGAEGVDATLAAAARGVVAPAAERARASGRPPFPDALAAIAHRALEAAPERRYEAVTDLTREVRELLRNEAAYALVDAARAELARLDAAHGGGRTRRAEAYPGYAAILAELHQAEKLAPTSRAREARTAAHVAYARAALAFGDIEVAESQLAQAPAADPEVLALAGRVATARARRRLQLRALSVVAIALVVAASVIVPREVSARKAAQEALLRHARAVAIAEAADFGSGASRIAAYQGALAADPSWEEAHVDLGYGYLSRAWEAALAGNPEAARPDVEAALASFSRAVEHASPENAQRYLKDRAYGRDIAGDLAGAISDLRRAAALDPASRTGGFAAAMVALALGDAPRVEALLLTSIGEEKPTVEELGLRAVGRFERGDLAGAEKDLRRCREIWPTWDLYLALHEVVLIAQGREAEAERHLVAAAEDMEHSPRLPAILAYLAARQGDLERARILAAHARRERERYAGCYSLPLTWGSIARALPPRDVLGRAVAGDIDVDALAPKTAPETLRLRRRAEERLTRGEVEAAFADIALVVAEHPADGIARRIRARCLEALGSKEAAADDRRLASLLLPKDAEAPK